uniref:Corticotropin-releasing factor receptor 2 n=1 Tax=Mus musculus TaxID=10090 RepID=UPI0000F51D1B|nr:Chain A, Corticotropin-releasing factor receptor 2 [Mus musculus]
GSGMKETAAAKFERQHMDSPDLGTTLLEQYCHRTTIGNFSGPYTYCNTTLDQIGTCWPQSAPGALVERPCPEYFNGIKYNTTRNAYRECLENGTWASRVNYSHCEPILDDFQRKYDLHY